MVENFNNIRTIDVAGPSATTSVEFASVEMILTRNGKSVNLGTVAYWHRSWFKRLAWRIGRFLRGGNSWPQF